MEYTVNSSWRKCDIGGVRNKMFVGRYDYGERVDCDLAALVDCLWTVRVCGAVHMRFDAK
jgi:hypothetical protein